MRCYVFEDRLDAYLDGELDAQATRDMQNHEAECEHCRILAEDARKLRAWLGEMGGEEPPAQLHEGLMQAVRKEAAKGKPKRRVNPWAIGGIAAAAVVLVCVGVPLSVGLLGAAYSGGYSSSMPAPAAAYDVAESEMSMDMGYVQAPAAAPVDEPYPAADEYKMETYDMAADDMVQDSATGGVGGQAATTTGEAHGLKLIRTGYVSIQTRAFDQDYQALLNLVEGYEGYIESSSASGVPYDADPNSYGRWANLTVRIPAQALDVFLADAKGVGNLVDSSIYSEDVTANYQDTELRLETLRTQHTRLTELLAKADKVEDLITLESELSRVQYEMDNLTGRLRSWDSRVDYASVSLSLNEVKTYSVESGVDPTLGERLSQGFFKGVNDFVEGSQDVMVALVSALPLVLIVVAIGVGAFFLIRHAVRRRKKGSRGDADAPRFEE